MIVTKEILINSNDPLSTLVTSFEVSSFSTEIELGAVNGEAFEWMRQQFKKTRSYDLLNKQSQKRYAEDRRTVDLAHLVFAEHINAIDVFCVIKDREDAFDGVEYVSKEKLDDILREHYRVAVIDKKRKVLASNFLTKQR